MTKPTVDDNFCPICNMWNDDTAWCRCDIPDAELSVKLLRRIYVVVGHESPERIREMIIKLLRSGGLEDIQRKST